MPHAVLDHHHRAIDDQPEIDRPRLRRLAVIPNRSIPEKANSMESGIANATISPARKLPRKTNNTAMTSRPPSNSSCDGVDHVVHQLRAIVDALD